MVARVLTGGGVTFTERDAAGTKVVDVVMLSATDFGGMVPSSILNSATGAALYALVSFPLTVIGDVFPVPHAP